VHCTNRWDSSRILLIRPLVDGRRRQQNGRNDFRLMCVLFQNLSASYTRSFGPGKLLLFYFCLSYTYSDFRKKEIRLARSSVFSGTRGPADLLNVYTENYPQESCLYPAPLWDGPWGAKFHQPPHQLSNLRAHSHTVTLINVGFSVCVLSMMLLLFQSTFGL
jgi:hypothetical protein